MDETPAGQAAPLAPGQEAAPDTQAPMQVEAAGSAAVAAAPAADADAMSGGPNLDPPAEGTMVVTEAGGDDVARLEDW